MSRPPPRLDLFHARNALELLHIATGPSSEGRGLNLSMRADSLTAGSGSLLGESILPSKSSRIEPLNLTRYGVPALAGGTFATQTAWLISIRPSFHASRRLKAGLPTA
jgi:hypothetical protein